MNNDKFIVVMLGLIVIFLFLGICSAYKKHEVNQKIKRLECEVEELRNINQSQEEVML